MFSQHHNTNDLELIQVRFKCEQTFNGYNAYFLVEMGELKIHL